MSTETKTALFLILHVFDTRIRAMSILLEEAQASFDLVEITRTEGILLGMCALRDEVAVAVGLPQLLPQLLAEVSPN